MKTRTLKSVMLSLTTLLMASSAFAYPPIIFVPRPAPAYRPVPPPAYVPPPVFNPAPAPGPGFGGPGPFDGRGPGGPGHGGPGHGGPGHGGPGNGRGNGFGRRGHPLPPGVAMGRRMVTPPARGTDPDEVQAAQMMAASISGLNCEDVGEALNRLSNQLLGNMQFATRPNPFPPAPGDARGRMREEMRMRWVNHLRSPQFWHKVWERLADAYRACNATCFDDGEAIGLISGAGYCSASVGVGGLTSPGFAYQPPLPLCENSVFVGCQSGYQKAVGGYEGCSTYATGSFSAIFNEYQSQDCHIDQ